MSFLLPRVRGSGKRTGGPVNLIRVLFAAFALLVFAPAHAAVPKGPGDCSANSPIPAGTVVAGCGDFGPSNAKFTIQVSNSDATTTWCVGGPVCNQVGFQQTHAWNTVSLCPSGSTPNAQGTCDCSAGYIEQGGQCVNPAAQCQAKVGTPSMVNYTVGWKRTPQSGVWDDYVHVNKLPPGGSVNVCNQGCQQTLDANAPCPDCKAWVSQVPGANGLYRASMDMMGSYSGNTCSPGPSDSVIVPDDTKDPPCPGYVGEVNGVRGCYGTAQTPITQVSADRPPPAVGQDTGNPAAGTKPSSGEGSGTGGAGRTPSSGSGGSAGGPAGAIGSGVKPDGTTAKPVEGKEQAACGAPGQPKCGIDESGTPSPWAENRWDSRIGDYRRAADDALGQIKTAGDGTFSGFGAFFMAPPLASCEPLEFPGNIGSLSKQCEVVDGVRSVMAYIWALGALWLCLGWIKKATA